jgi:hypothetical protein
MYSSSDLNRHSNSDSHFGMSPLFSLSIFGSLLSLYYFVAFCGVSFIYSEISLETNEEKVMPWASIPLDTLNSNLQTKNGRQETSTSSVKTLSSSNTSSNDALNESATIKESKVNVKESETKRYRKIRR